MKIRFHLLCLALLASAYFAFKPQDTVKMFVVTHTQKEWQAELDTLHLLQGVVGYPMSRQSSDAWQAVLIRMQQRFVVQLARQAQKDSVPKAKTDSATVRKKH
jgi:hypothetical protein